VAHVLLGRLPAVVVAASVLVVMSAAVAQAAPPVQFRFTITNSFTDTTTCGFSIDLNFQLTIVGRDFFDDQGNFARAIVEEAVIGTDSANGITLPESDHWIDFINAALVDTQVGLPIHIQGGGVVVRDAGFVVFNPDGSVAYFNGPHPFLEGDVAAYCAALS